MSMTDPIADLFTRIRNGQAARKPEVSCAASKLKLSIATLLRDEGYIAGFTTETNGAKATLTVQLKYHEGRPVIERLERVSRPGLRSYRGKSEIPKVLGGLGIAIVSTSRGVMTDRQARAVGQGGEILGVVS
ncbi:MAG: 30S ribosomal protein S8 [Pseudomonadota bacterium]|jgi:small subunit ribosomal protein S8